MMTAAMIPVTSASLTPTASDSKYRFTVPPETLSAARWMDLDADRNYI